MLNQDQAYVLGLLVGGGIIANNTFVIDLPLKRWGEDPQRMSQIARDILTSIRSKFTRAYSCHVDFTILNNRWRINPAGSCNLDNITNHLSSLNLPTSGFLLNSADLSTVKDRLSSTIAGIFLSGIFDTRASLTAAHRRFTMEAPVVSIEIPGSTKNFKFVVQLCSWLTSLGSITDQILYNHPCQHSSTNPYYRNWKKGFKIRFLVKSFLATHSFALKAKAIDIQELERLQIRTEQVPCPDRSSSHASLISIHQDINSDDLPGELKGKLFFHYHHICAAMGCPYAPLDHIRNMARNYREYVSFFPLLVKNPDFDTLEQQYNDILLQYFDSHDTSRYRLSVQEVIDNPLLEGYPEKENGLAFLFANELNGNRHRGSKDKIIHENIDKNVDVKYIVGTEKPPVLMVNPENRRGVIMSNIQGKVNQELIDNNIEREDLIIKLNT